MRFVIDLDTLEVIKSTTDRSVVSQVEGKRGDDSPFEVIFVRSGVAEELAGSTVLTFGAKQAGKYDAAAVVLNSAFSLSGTGPTAKYLASPSFNTEELNALFLIDENAANDPAYVDLMAEFTWQVGAGPPSSTKTFSFRVHNDVVRDSELNPTPIPTPVGDTAPVNGVKATTILIFQGATNPAAGTTVTLGSITYTFADSPASGTYEVFIDPVISNTATNFRTKINATNSDVNATGVGSGPTLYLEAIEEGTAGNSIAFSVSDAGEFDAAPEPFEGGIDATITPPFIRVAGDLLYIQQAGVWMETNLYALGTAP